MSEHVVIAPEGDVTRRRHAHTECVLEARKAGLLPFREEIWIHVDTSHLLAAIELARRARERGNHPFGALLVDEKGTVLLEAENTVRSDRDVTAHAETNLIRMATNRFDKEFLAQCTLYTSTEPCAMCAGAIYWGNVRRVVFALSEEEIRRISEGNPENFQIAISAEEIFARGDHEVEVSGPHLLEQARAVHDDFWD
jgi:tRNA(Arg) A34 adenosine deaminase TadA